MSNPNSIPKPTRDLSRAEEDNDDVFVDMENDSTADADTSLAEASIAKDETRKVAVFRVMLMLVLLAAALIVSLLAYFGAKEAEEKEFVDSFVGLAQKVVTDFETDAAEKRTAIVSLSRQLTSHAVFANETWPFVTLPDWEMRARLTLELAEVIAIMVLPLVTRDNLEKWGEYTVENQAWYWEGMELQTRLTGLNATTTGVEHFDEYGLSVDGEIQLFTENGPQEDLISVTDEEGPFFPAWQYTPQIPVPVINADFRTFPEATAELDAYLADDRRRNLASSSFEFEAGSGGAVFLDLLLERWQAGGGNQYSGGPLAYYYIPIYDSFGGGGRNSTTKLVGVLQAFIYWQTYFEALLPKTATGIVVVLENTCDQSYTYSISGYSAEYLGNGDLHDSKYDHMEASTDYGVFLQRDPEGPDGNSGGCFYRIRLYPSQAMEDEFITNEPLVICLSILGVFAFTTMMFILYDRFVEKRQKLVMQTAKQTSDVVHKLFPETVRERLYESDAKGRESHSTQSRTSTMMGFKFQQTVESDLSTVPGLNGCSPIADEYPHCTIFFADLAGFTKWSSTRTPSEVFLLLETLYGAFDKIAKRLNVFKVETIGDCYVAVTGLPRPQANHAIIMTKFATNCMAKMNQIVNSEDILSKLGDGTSLLQFRVGLHSGPVTAGVLRGEKARFQLFGDTVNTASRMESNGQKGRIQVSQTTADLLIAAGKQKWLTAREDMIEAKGKGRMQTYWVSIVADSSARSSDTARMSSSVVDNHNSSGIELPEQLPVKNSSKIVPDHQEGYDEALEV